jgi:hypothetical protein
MRTIPKVFVKPFKTDDRAFMPQWKCFCCRDTGYLLERDVKKFIDPDYSIEFCGTAQCAYCQAEKPAFAHSILSFSECEEIHLFNLQDWKNTANNWQSFKTDRQEAMKAIAAFTGGHYDDHQSERLENIEKAKQEFDF